MYKLALANIGDPNIHHIGLEFEYTVHRMSSFNNGTGDRVSRGLSTIRNPCLQVRKQVRTELIVCKRENL